MAIENKAEHWRSLAAETRARAERTRHEETKDILLSIANGYERMAEQQDRHDAVLREMEELEAKSSTTKKP